MIQEKPSICSIMSAQEMAGTSMIPSPTGPRVSFILRKEDEEDGAVFSSEPFALHRQAAIEKQENPKAENHPGEVP